MNKKFLIAWIVLFVAWFIGSFVVHGVLLHNDYMQLTNLFRTEADSQQYFALMIVAHVILSGAFVWIFARGVEAKPWLAQGVRFGIAVALLTIVPSYMIYFVVQPMPAYVVVKQIVFDGVLLVILGAIVAWLYRGHATASPRHSYDGIVKESLFGATPPNKRPQLNGISDLPLRTESPRSPLRYICGSSHAAVRRSVAPSWQA